MLSRARGWVVGVFFVISSLILTDAKADAIKVSTYNVSLLPGVSTANLDSAGNVLALRADGATEEYTTSGSPPPQAVGIPNARGADAILDPPNQNPPPVNPGPLPGDYESIVVGENASGQEYGFSLGRDRWGGGLEHPWYYSGGQFTPLKACDGSWGVTARAINQLGDVTGDASVGGNQGHALLYTSGKMVDLGTLGGRVSMGFGVNDHGQVVGFSERRNCWFRI